MADVARIADLIARAQDSDMVWQATRLGPETAEWWREQERRDAQIKAEREAEQLERDTKRIRGFKLPITARDEELIVAARLEQTPVLVHARTWFYALEAKPWIVLCGPVGRGKTFAASTLLFAVGGRYVGARELERLSMAKFGDDQGAYQALLDQRGLLVIDDLGREDDAGRMQSALLDLVDYRRSAGKRTIAITNFVRKGFEERYADARLLSRLAECAQWVVDRGEDMRRQKR